MTILIDQGLILKPVSGYEDYQRIVVGKPRTLELNYYGDDEYIFVYAFCIDPFKDVPSFYVEFEPSGKAPSSLVQVLRTIEEKGMLDTYSAQLAVWIASNPHDTEEIMNHFIMEDVESGAFTQEELALVEEVVRESHEILRDAGSSIDLTRYINVIREKMGYEPVHTSPTDDWVSPGFGTWDYTGLMMTAVIIAAVTTVVVLVVVIIARKH